MDPLKPADAKPMGREGAAQSSASAAPAVTPAPPAPAAPSRDVSPLIRELGLTEDHAAEPTALVTPGDLLRAAQALKDQGFMLMDTVGIDYSTYTEARPKRFAVLHNIYHPRDHRRLFLRVWLDDGEVLPSLYPV